MKITIFYFSGTGNTWFVANTLAELLNYEGADTTAYSIETIDTAQTKELIKSSDKIVIGFPIYGSAAPKVMDEFMDNLPAPTKPTGASVYTTVSLYSGDGPVLYRKHLKERGYTFENGIEFILSNNLNIPGFPDVLHVGDQNKIDKRNAKAANKSIKLANALLSGKNVVNYDKVLGRINGAIQRKFVDEFINKMNETLMVKHDKCIKCMRCVKMCPVDNISFTDDKIVFSDKCMACMRCYHFCPTTAINITEKSLDTKKWPRYPGPNKDYVKTLL